MSVTDELPRLLDERGVEYTVVHGYQEYIWEFGESGIARASRIGTKGLVQMIVTGMTPAQAIAATLGRGTCQMEYAERPTKGTLDAMGVYFCSECGSPTYNDCMPRYCIYCGAEVTA